MGAIEEGGKVAAGVVEGLKSQPISLALIVVNIIFLTVMVWMLSKVSEATQATNIRHDALVAQFLKDCVPQPRRD